MVERYLKNSTMFLVFIPSLSSCNFCDSVAILWSQDCQCSIYLYPRKSRKPRKPWFTLHRKITQYYRTISTQSQSLEKSMANVPRWILAIYIDTVSLQELGEIIQFSQLLIQNWLTLLQISLLWVALVLCS